MYNSEDVESTPEREVNKHVMDINTMIIDDFMSEKLG